MSTCDIVILLKDNLLVILLIRRNRLCLTYILRMERQKFYILCTISGVEPLRILGAQNTRLGQRSKIVFINL